ncbi:glycerol kinase [Beutenbergia cavernae DSM 12333]|uniref:Glycerol kinase n=1 Tax=Beutenbergia cavernae (strain ATCC BAA-8 / DSM 12333 / CCUG 43141 / JCM 11478 / NBRC 16432 / NCIMB 13614 / HKI 0122) TaxID=471853 RepID=GLPK_BEUC1|nr:glycerol kinase GlpK [Beutenbergia cavernae]C5C1C4.1 RecName: Full=Glycerol kinase; AltName: Full=ATP:glycerol 3-phosphotransferase; AltName: Full=Glycerokinase; Short=GK [Beutenbergia cavernae DSM 12333]ACQ81534.1 glycerol kinase [Beutenbergia cavernae DSM 12333]
MADYVLAIDQGTTSSRAIIFDHSGTIVATGQKEHEQIFPRAGWVEHDPEEIWTNVRDVVGQALGRASVRASNIAAIGITNQRETAVVWDRTTGKPVYNAIVWQDTRTQRIVEELGGSEGAEKYKARVGLPLATYFSGPKIKWILDNVDGAREAAERGDLLFGNTDTWVLWNMTGGVNGGVHVTDVTNASRTMLMDLDTLSWNPDIAADMGIPVSMLPEIRSSSEVYGKDREEGLLAGVPIAGILGDQQAATFGQACFEIGMAKNTYGTGNFMLMNTGTEQVASENGLLTTVCYKIGDQPQVYALEGSIAVTGSLVQWLRDNLKVISTAPEIENLALTVEDNGGAYFVPAFSGLFAPYWRADARGALVGLTRYVSLGHIARAALEATAFQSAEVLDAMKADSGVDLTELKVDGGMVANEVLMQFQADILGVDVVRPKVAETTALGAAYAAGIAVGFWNGEQDVIDNWAEDKRWTPQMDRGDRDRLYRNWKKAVTKTFDWVDDDVEN